MLRPDDRHLTEEQLESLLPYAQNLAELIPSLLPDEVAVAHIHLLGCTVCSNRFAPLVAADRQLFALLGEVLAGSDEVTACRGKNCPSEIEWPRIAAGAANPVDAEASLRHAAKCDYCGPLLRQALQDFEEEFTPEENRSISLLKTARAATQANLAVRISGRSADAPSAVPFQWLWDKLGPSRLAPRAVLAGAAIAATVTALWIFRPDETPERLLASAYAHHRTLEMRIPDAEYSPLQVERGAPSSELNDPPELLRAEAEIAEQLKLHPDAPRWLLVKGEADLLDNDAEAAQSSLELAHRAAPKDARISLDLASSYFLVAETRGISEPYTQAVALLRQITTEHPSNAEAWFNLAIALERGESFQDALQAWDVYLRLDSHSAWSKEAESRRRELQVQLQRKKK